MSQIVSNPDKKQVVSKALQNAAREMGLTQTQIGQVIGKDRGVFSRGIDPESKSGELALLLIRVYRSLYALVGGDPDNIKHWIRTENHHLGGIPAEVIKRTEGLVHVVEYLDAMRGKV